MTLTIADYSEYQGQVHPSAGQVVIIRAHNGWRADYDFAANRANAHAAGCPAVGIYQYLPSSVDPAAAARLLLQTVGRLAGNEWLICDLEEGAGDQQARWQTWRTTVMSATGRPPWLYSGLAFAEAHNLAPDWVAAYGQSEPTVPHKLWQDSDAYPWPWGASDASVYDGTLPQFLDAAGITLPAPVTPAPTPTQEEDMAIAEIWHDGTNQYLVGADLHKIPLTDTAEGSALETGTLPLTYRQVPTELLNALPNV